MHLAWPFNYLKKYIIETQVAPTQSYNGPKSSNNSAQVYTNSLILAEKGYKTIQGKAWEINAGLKFLLLNYSNFLRIKKTWKCKEQSLKFKTDLLFFLKINKEEHRSIELLKYIILEVIKNLTKRSIDTSFYWKKFLPKFFLRVPWKLKFSFEIIR